MRGRQCRRHAICECPASAELALAGDAHGRYGVLRGPAAGGRATITKLLFQAILPFRHRRGITTGATPPTAIYDTAWEAKTLFVSSDDASINLAHIDVKCVAGDGRGIIGAAYQSRVNIVPNEYWYRVAREAREHCDDMRSPTHDEGIRRFVATICQLIIELFSRDVCGDIGCVLISMSDIPDIIDRHYHKCGVDGIVEACARRRAIKMKAATLKFLDI